MPGLVPGIHVLEGPRQDVDGRGMPGHDAWIKCARGTEIESRARKQPLAPTRKNGARERD